MEFDSNKKKTQKIYMKNVDNVQTMEDFFNSWLKSKSFLLMDKNRARKAWIQMEARKNLMEARKKNKI